MAGESARPGVSGKGTGAEASTSSIFTLASATDSIFTLGSARSCCWKSSKGRKEIEVKRLISKLENDIALWKNNIEFFAKSKNADKVRAEFNEKIAQATSQLKELREELKVLNKI